MGELTAETFADWLPPSDVVNWYYQQGLGDDEAEARVSAMLRDGLLRAAATRLVVDGRDLGLALIRRELWEVAIHPDLWVTGRFRVRVGSQTISAYAIRIDRDEQTLPEGAPTSLPLVIPRKQTGGRPPATWWDDLWIEVCRQIYVGDLKPVSQAAIERAMHDWLSAQRVEAGDTTIRTRARRLFRALASEDGEGGN